MRPMFQTVPIRRFGHSSIEHSCLFGHSAGLRTLLFGRSLAVGIIFIALLGLYGCGHSSPPVQVQPQSGLERAKGILNDYASGVPMGSEAATFEEVVAEV